MYRLWLNGLYGLYGPRCPLFSKRPINLISLSLSLSHLTLDTMAAILADNIFNCIFLNENDRNVNQISLKYVPSSPIDNKPALAWVMAWRWIDNKPLPEPMLTQFIDAYIYAALGGDQLRAFGKELNSVCNGDTYSTHKIISFKPIDTGHVDSLVQDCSNSIANALELPQSCTKPSIWYHWFRLSLIQVLLVT